MLDPSLLLSLSTRREIKAWRGRVGSFAVEFVLSKIGLFFLSSFLSFFSFFYVSPRINAVEIRGR